MRHRLASLFLATLVIALLFSTLNISPRLTQAQGAPELPDLIVDKIECGPGSKLAVTVKNMGAAALPAGWMALAEVYFNQQKMGFFDLRYPTTTTGGGIASPGGSSYYLLSWNITQQVSVFVVADYTSSITESNEQNNNRLELISPCPTPTPTPATSLPDLIVDKIDCGPGSKLAVTVKNIGAGTLPGGWTAQAGVYFDQQYIGFFDLKYPTSTTGGGIEQPGGSSYYLLSWDITQQFSVLVVADFTSSVTESNEQNNNRLELVSPCGAPTPSPSPSPTPSLTATPTPTPPTPSPTPSTSPTPTPTSVIFVTPPHVYTACLYSISGTIHNFFYDETTLKIKICEAETITFTSSDPRLPPLPPVTQCKDGGWVAYYDVTRQFSGDLPGPDLDYRIRGLCPGEYIVAPIYSYMGSDSCRWEGTWRSARGQVVTITDSSATGYDFTFTPQDLTPPSIQTRTTDASPPATFKGEGNFQLYVEAIDSTDGVQSARVSGTYRVSYFRSDATGPLESMKSDETHTLSQECSLLYQGSSTIPYASCRFDIPYYEGGKSITFDLRISACDAAGNKVETTYSHTFPDEPGDLALATVEPIQVIYGAPLVKNKNTAFRAKVNSSFPYPVEASFRLTLPPDKWGLTSGTGRVFLAFPISWSFPDLWGPIKIPANASNYEIMLPIIADWQKEISGRGAGDATKILGGEEVSGIYGVDVRLMPVPKADQVNFSVQIDPENQIRETNEGGNTFNSPNYDVVKTRTWRFLVVPYKDERGCAPYRPFVEEGVKRYLEYLLATYPIAENKLEYAFATTPYSQRCTHDPSLTCEFVRTMNRGATELRQWTARLAEAEGYDFGIAVGCSGGQANFNVMAVTVGDSGKDELLAHEFNHAVAPVSDIYSWDCYSSWAESYCELPDGNRFYCCWQDYTDEKERREENGIDPMEGCIIDCGQNDRGDCNAGCCWDRCKAECDDRGGTTWQAPDGRPSIMGIMPAADGFWVNKWVEKESKQYFMDGPTGDNWISARSVRGEGYHYCPSPDAKIDYDGYLNMLTHERFVSTTDPEGLLVSGTINRNGEVKFDPFIYLPDTLLDIAPGRTGDYYFVLSDKDNNTLSKAGFDVYFYQSDPYGGPVDEVPFVYRIEWKESVKKIELQDKTGKVLASREVSENKPEIKVIHPNGGEVFTQGERIRIKWEANDKDGDVLSYSLSLSKDNGESWLPVDIDIETNEYEIDTTSLSPADYLVKVRATDGVNTSTDSSDGVFSLRTDGKSQSPYVIYVTAILTIMAIIIAFVIYRSKSVKRSQ